MHILKLYHGSNVIVSEPRIIVSNRNLDFGVGFYTTASEEQAINWAKRQAKRMKQGKATVSVYQWQQEKLVELNILRFEKANAQWLEFVAQNRQGIYQGEMYDIVIGAVANDRTMRVISDYISGELDIETSLLLLKPQVLDNQYVFLNAKALGSLQFEGANYYE